MSVELKLVQGSAEPGPEETMVSATLNSHRPNEEWWKSHGGEEWLQAISERRPNQHHYGQQEAFLFGFFAGLPPARVLDYGCGFGRHLRYLKQLPQHEFHGCDISAKMLETAARYIDDPVFASKRLQLLTPRQRLPYPDGHFDIVLTSEVLIHVDSLDIPAILRELLRVSKSLILHVENVAVTGSRRENDAHEGCWLHDFRAIYSELGSVELAVHPHPVQRQCVYLVSKPGGTLAASVGVEAQARLAQRLEREVAAQRRENENLRRELATKTTELEAARRDSEQRPISPNPLRLPSLDALSLRLRRAAGVLPEGGPKPDIGPSNGGLDLGFGGFATRASHRTPEEFAAGRPEIVALCHPDWRGIRAATYGQCPYVLEVPGYASAQQVRSLAAFLSDCGTRKLVVHGYPPGSEVLLRKLSLELPDLGIYCVYHGSPALFHFGEHQVIQQMVELHERGVLRKIGFVKKGIAEFFRQQGHAAEQVMNVCRFPAQPARRELGSDGKYHVGVFGSNVCHKNVETQLVAALMLPGTTVHVMERPTTSYLEGLQHRIVAHGLLPHDAFLDVLRQMHATSYVSLVECYPMTVLESIAAGAPCLTSHTSALFDSRPDLFEQFVVTTHDDAYAIAQRLARIIERREQLVPQAQLHLEELNRLAEKRWQEFLFQ